MVRIRDQMQYFYMEMTRDEAKSNLAKWNLFADTNQAHERLPNIHFSAVIGYVLIGLRTFSWQVQM